MEWGVKSLIWGVLSNGVSRDTKGVYIEPLLKEPSSFQRQKHPSYFLLPPKIFEIFD